MKTLKYLSAALLLSFGCAFNVHAGSVSELEELKSEVITPEQKCDKALIEAQKLEQKVNTPAEAKLEKEEPSWFETLVKQHKLGSLHFQDIIEFFH